tara:strand:- start:1840 stop:2412 length:573 start_codon:yes stop_codon:yes gene_type:complete
MWVVWVVGEPGVGKSSALETLMNPFGTSLLESPKWTISPPYAFAGHYGGIEFGGGDTISYTDAARQIHDLSSIRGKLRDELVHTVFFDGDRLSNETSFRLVEDASHEVLCVLLTCEASEAARRRSKRSGAQNQAWVKGRKTKSANFTTKFEPHQVLTIDTSNSSAEEVGERIANWCKDWRRRSYTVLDEE